MYGGDTENWDPSLLLEASSIQTPSPSRSPSPVPPQPTSPAHKPPSPSVSPKFPVINVVVNSRRSTGEGKNLERVSSEIFNNKILENNVKPAHPEKSNDTRGKKEASEQNDCKKKVISNCSKSSVEKNQGSESTDSTQNQLRKRNNQKCSEMTKQCKSEASLLRTEVKKFNSSSRKRASNPVNSTNINKNSTNINNNNSTNPLHESISTDRKNILNHVPGPKSKTRRASRGQKAVNGGTELSHSTANINSVFSFENGKNLTENGKNLTENGKNHTENTKSPRTFPAPKSDETVAFGKNLISSPILNGKAVQRSAKFILDEDSDDDVIPLTLPIITFNI